MHAIESEILGAITQFVTYYKQMCMQNDVYAKPPKNIMDLINFMNVSTFNTINQHYLLFSSRQLDKATYAA